MPAFSLVLEYALGLNLKYVFTFCTTIFYYRLSYICKEEGVKCDDDTLTALVETSGGDMRRAITCLQSCAKLVGSNMTIDMDNVLEVTGVRDESICLFLYLSLM